ncbi:hypothetical protein Unana1_02392 [Umbelopsis nana]
MSAVDNTRAASLFYTEAESSGADDSERVIALASQQLTMTTLRHNLLNTKFVLDQVAQRGTTPSGQTMSLFDQTSRVQGVVVHPSTAVGLRQLARNQMPNSNLPIKQPVAEDLFSILPAGGGQSLRLMLPAYLEKNLVTVVIVLLVPLLEDPRLRLEDYRIPCEEWTANMGTVDQE